MWRETALGVVTLLLGGWTGAQVGGFATAAYAQPATSDAADGYTKEDVRFLQGMIHHHAQAVEMSLLVPDRAERDIMHLVAERILVSQRDEIKWMRHWLQRHGESAPGLEADAPEGSGESGGRPAADHNHGHLAESASDGTDSHGTASHSTTSHAAALEGIGMMPGMLTSEQMARLKSSRGAAFEKLFFEYMIYHHKGALTMVEELFASGSGQGPEIFRFASDVDADQRAEIRRMQEMLDALGEEDPHHGH